jgi:hypothetical protein
LSTISNKFTNGNVWKAEGLFLDIVKDGVAGLIGKQEEENVSNPSVQSASGELILEDQQVLTPVATRDSTMVRIKTTTRRNRGAIQRHPPNEDDIDLGGSIDSLISAGDANARTTPTPLSRCSTAFSDQEPEPAAKRVEDWENIVDGDRGTDTFGFRSCSHKSSISTFTDAMMYLESTERLEKIMLSSPWQDESTSLPLTPEYSKFDEYEIVGSQPAENKELMKRVRSVSNILPKGTDVSDLIPTPLTLKRSSSAHCFGGGTVSEANNRVGLNHNGTGFRRCVSYIQRPSHLPMLSGTGRASLALTQQVLSEHEISVRDPVASGAEAISRQQHKGKRTLQPFQPVFTIAEDLIILFNGGARNETFEYVVRSYKNGSYPGGLLSCPLGDSLRVSPLSFPYPPSISISPFAKSSARLKSARNIKYKGKILNADGMDRFASRGSTLSANRVHPNVVGSTSGSKLDTLALTPASTVQDTTEKFYEVESSDGDSVVDVQNCLRALLRIPPFIQSTNPLQPPPVLANDVLPRLTTKIDERQGNVCGPISPMLAFGCEDGVDKHVYIKILRQVEKLWCDTAHGNGIHVLDVR